MTLHDAIVNVLIQYKNSIFPFEIAYILNQNKWYSKKDGSEIKSSQISARVRNYLYLFTTENGLVSLKS